MPVAELARRKPVSEPFGESKAAITFVPFDATITIRALQTNKQKPDTGIKEIKMDSAEDCSKAACPTSPLDCWTVTWCPTKK